MKHWGRWVVLALAWGALEVSDASRLVFVAVLLFLVVWFMQTDINQLTQQLAKVKGRLDELECETWELERGLSRPAVPSRPAQVRPVAVLAASEAIPSGTASDNAEGTASGTDEAKVFLGWLGLGAASLLVKFWPQLSSWFQGAH